MFRVITSGATLSSTVTIAVSEADAPLLLVTDKVTAFSPILEQSNKLGDTLIDCIPEE